ncbi:MAG: radical SAM protein [bacterium]|nr:radical SAM protein [bacterium]
MPRHVIPEQETLATHRVPDLISGGLILTYRCTNRCRHCLYNCSPRQTGDWISVELVDQSLAALAQEQRLQGIHIAGGEATLNMDLVEEVIALAAKHQVPIDYLETNAFWCRDDDVTRLKLERLRDAGLPGVLVSASLFHNEFVPFANTRRCVEIGQHVFGPQGVIIYQPQMYQLLESLENDGKHTLEEACAELAVDPASSWVPQSYGVIPSGRATTDLRSCFRASPPESFEGITCADHLLNTSHFHIDPCGNLITGLCAGIRMASVYDLHPAITPESHPVSYRLIEDGPYVLMLEAVASHGYEPRQTGYISRCDLCVDVRRHLWQTGRFHELQPDGFYSEG